MAARRAKAPTASSSEGTCWEEGRGETLTPLPSPQFNAPFDVGIKLFGDQYQQHSRALGKFLQNILWEEAKGESSWVRLIPLP